MEYVVYDVLPTWAFKAGSYNEPYWSRRDRLAEQLCGCGDGPGQVYAAFSEDALGTDVQARANEYVKQGGHDGLILRDPGAFWVVGPARNGEIIKVKPSVSLDLMCTGYSYKKGAKTGRDVLTLTVAYRGVETEVGSGVPHSLHWTDAFAKIIEVECMSVNTNNTLREPRFKAIRFDKEQPDE